MTEQRGDPSVVQRYLLASLERDEYSERAKSAEVRRLDSFARASAFLKDHGGMLTTNVNNGPSYVVWYEGGRINYKQVEELFPDERYEGGSSTSV